MNFADTLRSAGLRPRDVIADGRLRRCATDAKPTKRNGWFVLHPDGRGVFGDNAVAPRQAIGHWRADERSQIVVPSPKVQAQMAAQRDRDRVYRIQAMRAARAYWAKARPLTRPHKYIADKGLTMQGCAGLREHDGLLIVPVWHGDWIISIQTITADGTKRFWPGAPVKAGAYVLDRARAAVTAICEGLATALAVYQCARHARVVVAFDSGNLLPAVERMRPTGSVVLVADNDHKTAKRIGVNPGIAAATNAASLIGAGVVWPTGIEGSDYADALAEIGEGAPRRIEREILAGARYVMAGGP